VKAAPLPLNTRKTKVAPRPRKAHVRREERRWATSTSVVAEPPASTAHCLLEASAKPPP
jgi:hypothetical protein